MNKVRIVIADDHALVLEAFKVLLSERFDVVGSASNGRELIRVVNELEPDIVVTDVSMPELNGLDASVKLLERKPGLKFIFLTVHDDPNVVSRAIHAGASGFLLKNSLAAELVQAVEAVSRGLRYITPLVTGTLQDMLVNGPADAEDEQLTVRQREVLQLLAEGKTMKQASRILHVTPRTIAFHKYHIMSKLALDNSAELVRYAFRTGLVAA